jgi:hypothetical protein
MSLQYCNKSKSQLTSPTPAQAASCCVISGTYSMSPLSNQIWWLRQTQFFTREILNLWYKPTFVHIGIGKAREAFSRILLTIGRYKQKFVPGPTDSSAFKRQNPNKVVIWNYIFCIFAFLHFLRFALHKLHFLQFILTVEGRGGKFNLKNTILNIGSGLALLGVSTVVCDFLLMYIKEKGVVKKKKYV